MGWKFGEPIIIKFQIANKPDAFELYAMALSIAEGPESKESANPFTFEESLEALNEAAYNSKKAIQTMLKKRDGGKKEDDQISSSQFDQKMLLDDDDLYQ